MVRCQPRRLSPKSKSRPILFTDGACEFVGNKRIATCGAILFPDNGDNPLCFGITIPDRMIDKWAREADKEQLVTEAELLPVLISLRCWRDYLAYSKCLIFVDSEPAKHCLIRGTSNVSTCADIVKLIYHEVDLLKMFPWFSRVPSKSNPADAPSRLDFAYVSKSFEAGVTDTTTYLEP